MYNKTISNLEGKQLTKYILDKLQQDPRVTVLHVETGQAAIARAEMLLEPETDIELESYTTKQRREAMSIIYKYTTKLKTRIGYRFVIGENVNGLKPGHPRIVRMLSLQ